MKVTRDVLGNTSCPPPTHFPWGANFLGGGTGTIRHWTLHGTGSCQTDQPAGHGLYTPPPIGPEKRHHHCGQQFARTTTPSGIKGLKGRPSMPRVPPTYSMTR